MTKKGIILIIILVILLIGIIVSGTIQTYKINKDIKEKTIEDIKDNPISKSDLEITSNTGFDLENLKSYGLPIIIQIGQGKDEIFSDMKPDLEILNKDTKGRAIIRLIDFDNYKEFLNEDEDFTNNMPIQILINSKGKPYETTASEALGYKMIKDEAGNHVYTIHEGDLTLNEMRGILVEMGMK